MHIRYTCSWSVNPLVDLYRFEMNLPDPWYQEEGQHFLLRICAIVADPDGECIFYWCDTAEEHGTPGGSWWPENMRHQQRV
jgi:hypothetical protein